MGAGKDYGVGAMTRNPSGLRFLRPLAVGAHVLDILWTIFDMMVLAATNWVCGFYPMYSKLERTAQADKYYANIG